MRRFWVLTAIFALTGPVANAELQNLTTGQGGFRSYENSPYQEFQSRGGPGTLVCFQNGTPVYRKQLNALPSFGSTAGTTTADGGGSLISGVSPQGIVQIMLEGGSLCVFE